MNIVFICGCLEPGRDGVGDYVRRLASELLRQGHQITAIALADSFVKQQIAETQVAYSFDFKVLRIPLTSTNKEKFRLAKEWIELYNPLWLSLQFVPFAFDSKGLPFKLGRQLSKLGKGRLWHIMFHELWVAMEQGAFTKHVFWAQLQKYLIKSLIVKLQPKAIHTQSRLYLIQLSKMAVKAKHLPLFSNIPVVFQSKEMLTKSSTTADLGKEVVLVNFGAIHPDALLFECIEEINSYSKKNHVSVSLILLGRSGEEKYKWITAFEAAGIKVEVLGEQSPERISEVLATASIGISTCAYPIIDKSGTVAAMLDHGLPVLCVSKPWYPKGLNFAFDFPGVFRLERGDFEEAMSHRKSNRCIDQLPHLSQSMVQCLEEQQA